jgi:hypothetical protein
MRLQPKRPVSVQDATLELIGPSDLCIAGRMTSKEAQEELGRHLREVHAYAVEHKLTTFTVDVCRLAFVNSSVIRAFVDFVSLAERAGYELVFRIDEAVTWHRLSFAVLQSLAPKCVKLVKQTPAVGKKRLAP